MHLVFNVLECLLIIKTRQAADLKVTLPTDLTSAAVIRNVIQYTQLALAISPLILLVPRNGATQSINKEQLFLVS